MRDLPKPGEVYRHFKNGWYKVIGIALHTETEERLVIYQSLSGDRGIFARPVNSFLDEVDKKKYPWCNQRYRMEKFK